jgi:hypothetical protein
LALRDLILKIAPAKMAAQMEAESRAWMLKCRSCGHEISYWEAGGLRFKAKGNPTVRIACFVCGGKRPHDAYKT